MHCCCLTLGRSSLLAAGACPLTGMERIAAYLANSGSYAAARDLQQQVLDARRAGLGKEHPPTLTAQADLARWGGAAGDAVGAVNRLAALVPVEERVLGPEHPQTLATRNILAAWTGEAGDAAGARDQYAMLLPVMERGARGRAP